MVQREVGIIARMRNIYTKF